MSCASDRDKALADCENNIHQFVQNYYGDVCRVCGLFVPDGHGWWMPAEEDDEEDYLDGEEECLTQNVPTAARS